MGLNCRIIHQMKLICDRTIPIVLLAGLPSSGKTFLLLRLCEYLRPMGYLMEADTGLLRDNEWYKGYVEKFMHNIYEEIIDPHGYEYPFLFKIRKNVRNICYILDVPGYFYTDNVAHSDFMFYLSKITNPIIWTFVVDISDEEGCYSGLQMREYYNQRQQMINELEDKIHKKIIDPKNVIIVCNKIDLERKLFRNDGRIVNSILYKILSDRYEDLSRLFRKSSIYSFLSPFKCKVVPFMSYYFNKICGTSELYITRSSDRYPNDLWNEMSKLIRKI